MIEPTYSSDVRTAGKRAAAQAAIDEVKDGMTVGLGTGSTAALAITALAERVAAGLKIKTVATSFATARAATGLCLPVQEFCGVASIDIAIDGADEIDPALRAIKGAGGAMLREKIVAASADRMICIVDESKYVNRLGGRPVPLEVLPFACAFVAARVESLGGRVARRMTAGAAFQTDQKNIVLDCRFDKTLDPEKLASQLADIPGILCHGLFIREIDAAYIGSVDGVVQIERRSSSKARHPSILPQWQNS